MRCAALHARRHARMGAQHGREGAGPGQPRAPSESPLLSLQTAITKCRRNRVAASGVARSGSQRWQQSRVSLDAVNRPSLSSNSRHPSTLRGEGSARSGTLGRLLPGKPNLECPSGDSIAFGAPANGGEVTRETALELAQHQHQSVVEPLRCIAYQGPRSGQRGGETTVAARQAAGEKKHVRCMSISPSDCASCSIG